MQTVSIPFHKCKLFFSLPKFTTIERVYGTFPRLAERHPVSLQLFARARLMAASLRLAAPGATERPA
jgi:hypothetical protein